MPAQFTSVALPVRSNDFCVLVGCQLQCSVFRYEIIIEHACIHGFPRIAPAEEDGAVLRRVDERHWRSAVVKGCDHHARAQPDGSDHVRVSVYDKICNSICISDGYKMLIAFVCHGADLLDHPRDRYINSCHKITSFFYLIYASLIRKFFRTDVRRFSVWRQKMIQILIGF